MRDSITLRDDVWIEPAGFLGTVRSIEKADGGVIYGMFVPGDDEEDDE